MRVSTRQMQVVSEVLDPDKLRVSMGLHNTDIDNKTFEVHYDGILIADGNLNFRTNWAHIEMSLDNEGNQELEDFLVKTIESGNY
jgi:hypothetical protein